MKCGVCMANPPPYHKARSVFRYDDHSKDLILSFKHADRTDLAPAYADWLARIAPELVSENTILAPVPLHPGRLLKRRFNQSAMLARALGRKINRPISSDLIQRIKATPSQGSKSFKGRFKNVEGAFRVCPKEMKQLKSQHILLIDDVFTTGATVEACSRALLKAGAKRVDVLTLCRVVRPSNLNI